MALDFFAQPPQLPHPEIPLSVILIIEEALRTAWEMLRNNPPKGFNLADAHEDIVTEKFLAIIVNEVLIDKTVQGFSKELFRVSREEKHPNYNRRNPDKMPDLSIHLLADRPDVYFFAEDRLYIECKPVGAERTVGKHYCGKGLIRFVEGNYAWTMSQAMMIGYTQAGYSIIPKLQSALQERIAMKTIQYPIPCPKSISQARSWCEAVHISCHERSFSYIETKQPAPPITLRHLWLRRD